MPQFSLNKNDGKILNKCNETSYYRFREILAFCVILEKLTNK